MASPRSLDEWLTHQSQVHPLVIALGLERLRAVLQRLAWRRPDVAVVTVAGTNGKGSVTAYTAAILKAAGYRTGTFTSPHLIDYRERIRIDGAWVSAAALIEAFERIEAARLKPPEIPLTFFEYNALAAFLVLEAAKLDAWVLEIGMGGRLDAVNLIDPDVAVIVSIGLDHQEFLGNSLEAIAAEKAGIMRAGVAAVLGNTNMPLTIETTAAQLGARLKRPGIDYVFDIHATSWDYRGSEWALTHLPAPALAGATQYGNAATAIAALEELRERFDLPQQAIARGLASVQLAGRFQCLAANAGAPQWILDVAHNPDSARVLAANLKAHPIEGRTLAVCGVLADKDLTGIVRALDGRIDEWWTVTLEGARGLSGTALAQRLADLGLSAVHDAASVAAGCKDAQAAARPADRIVIFGSFHTVGPALEWLQAQQLLPPGTLT